ncbi:MAG: hypothetical protein KGQ89_01955 [Verrucomicrobia bacterium]|nr:hypothetical protein [Verrucomicrobiota bacterium]
MKHCIPTTLLFCLLTSAHAEKLVVKEEKFSIRPALDGTLLPDKAIPLAVDAKEWSLFTILEILPHGSLVKKGDVLLRFDAEDFEKKLRDAGSAVDAGQLALANAEDDFKAAEKYLPLQLQAAISKDEEAGEEWEYFQKTSRDSAIKEAELALKQVELRADSEREELVQLEKMYKADDLTENTEEIILKRQREMVKAMAVNLELAKLAHARTLGTTLPRLALKLERDAQNASIARRESEQSLPRSLKLKRIALEQARVDNKRQNENWGKLKADQQWFVIKAPADGYFFHGTIQEGRWTTGDAVKTLIPGGAVASKRPFATLIPADVPLVMEAFVEEKVQAQLKTDLCGFASSAGRPEISFPVKIEKLAAAPGIDGRYRVTLSAKYPADLALAPGMSTTAHIICYQEDAALVVPAKALHATDDGGWELEIEQSESKTSRVAVKRGRTSGDKVEILSGLAKDQVVITPGA